MIPTMMARTPSRINEVDVDLNMTGTPLSGFAAQWRVELRGACRYQWTSGRHGWPTSAANRHIAAGF